MAEKSVSFNITAYLFLFVKFKEVCSEAGSEIGGIVAVDMVVVKQVVQ